MASSENLDELLAGLASMGFEFEDCHEALQAGHTNLESAVEWLMERKSHSPSVPTHDCSTDTPKDDTSGSSGDLPLNVPSDHGPLVSRCTISEDARKAKERFIEKEREQARTEAKKRKVEEKRARQQILMQIADDKELRKAKCAPREKGSLSDQHTSTSIKDVVKPKRDIKECLLKVRLPNGQVRTGAVSVSRSLTEALVMLSPNMSFEQQEFNIIQPFPHKIFTLDELTLSLESLGLHPSAMIVVQRRQDVHSAGGSQAQSRSVPQNNQQEPDRHPPVNYQNVREQELPGNRLPPNSGALPPDNSAHPDNNRPEPEAPDNEGNLPDDDDDIHPPDDAHERQEPEVPGFARQPPGMDIDPGVVGRRQFPQWPGEGMRLGAVEYNPHSINPALPSSSPGESAARRIEMREHRLQHLLVPGENITDVPHLHREVRRLEEICVDDVALRVSGHPKLQPIATLGTLSSNICDKILERLMKKKALSPKTMNAFLSCCLRCLRLDCYLLVTNELLSALRWHKHLTLLSLKSCPLITDKAMESIAVLKKLQSLNINQCSQLTDKCFNSFKELPSLTVLQMDGTKVTDEGVSYFVSHANCATKLVHLSLCSTAITDLSLEFIKNLKSLKVLEVENTKITKLDALSEMSSLERLNASHTQLTDNSIAAIRHHSSLKSLNLLSTNITDHGLQQLHGLHLTSLRLPNRLTITDQGLYYIKDFPLTALDISDYINISDLGIQYISTVHSLTKLTLSNTRLSDVGLRSLSGLVELVELNLDRTMITDDGCAVIQNFQNLQILSLSSTHITNKMLLNGVLNCCTKLSQLNLSRTRVSNKGISCLNLLSLTSLNLDWTRVTFDCQILLTGCPCLKALRTNNCSPPSADSDEEED